VFGEVVEGLDVVQKIGAVATGRQDRLQSRRS
jgi:cyclophilin family peptidyl-prolyl cis-trans isomerase